MGRAEFEYDEVGNTFYYVLISFYAIILIPATYIFFPTGRKEKEVVDERLCQCEGCVTKRRRKEESQPFRKIKKFIAVGVLAVAWLLFILLVQKVSSIEVVHEEYDPFAILELDAGSPVSAIKKKYRDLSKIHHPDRGGDAVVFDKIAKAYQALTDDEARENWEKYGNPDGPTATTFGIALPKWIISKEYGVWVLAFYGLIFMILMPTAVGMWWYNSIKYSVDKVLLDTTQLFYYFTQKTPKMEMNRALMVLTGSFEFWKQYNKEIVERESDDVELPRLMKQLSALSNSALGENKKERPLNMPYALKARILTLCHLHRIPVDSLNLEFDKNYMLSRSIRLVEEMINISQHLTFYSQQRNVPYETIENQLRLQPMLVQGLWPKNSPLLQLPHIDDSLLYQMKRVKARIATCADLAGLDEEKRRAALAPLSDQQYRDVLIVLASMPRLEISTAFEVEGEDDKHDITAGCVVTLKVTLTRKSLLDGEKVDDVLRKRFDDEDGEGQEGSDGDEEKEEEEGPKKAVWKKKDERKKGGKKKGGAAAKQQRKAAEAKKKAAEEAGGAGAGEVQEVADDKEDKEEDGDESGDESVSGEDSPLRDAGEEDATSAGDDSDEDDWVQPEKKKTHEVTSHATHPVHAPLFPGEKFEWWWLSLTITDKKFGKRLYTTLSHCKTLVDEQTVSMRFQAPEHKGQYTMQLEVHSDSYMDADYCKDIKLTVKEAAVVELPKYEDTEDEEEGQGEAVESSEDEYTEDSDSD